MGRVMNQARRIQMKQLVTRFVGEPYPIEVPV